MSCCHKNNNCHLSYLDDEVFHFAEKEWCIFHLPFEDNEGNKSIKNDYGPEESGIITQKIIDYINNRKNAGFGCDLSHVYFPGEISFYTTLPALNLSSSVFKDDAFFVDLVIDESLLQNETGKPPVRSGFINIKFNGRCSFVNSKIKTTHSLQFRKCIFTKCCLFFDSEFTNDVTFKDAEIKCDANFKNATFLGDLSIENVQFDGDFNFQYLLDENTEDKSPKIRYFEANNIKIKGEALFTNRQFIGNVNFTDAEFHIAPDFSGCDIHESIIFPIAKNFKDTNSLLSANRYRVLRNSMSKIKAHREEGMFFTLEQTSLINTKQVSKIDGLFSSAYRLISNYSENAIRPLIILFSLYLFFSIIYALIISPVISFESNIDWSLVGESFGFSFSQITQPFTIFNPKITSTTNQFINGSYWVKPLAAIQSFLSISCIALFILSIRWKFKKG